MTEHISPVLISDAIRSSIELSRQTLQSNQLYPGDTVMHDLFDTELTVIKHIDQHVYVEFYNPLLQKMEQAILPIQELYYPDLAAGALILQIGS